MILFFYFLKCCSFSLSFKIVGQHLVVDVPSEVNSDKKFSAIDYKVKVAKAPGGRLGGGKGRKDKLGVDWWFECTCGSYENSAMCKHIGALVISQFN